MRTWLWLKLSILRDKPYIWSRPIDWIRYKYLFNDHARKGDYE